MNPAAIPRRLAYQPRLSRTRRSSGRVAKQTSVNSRKAFAYPTINAWRSASELSLMSPGVSSSVQAPVTNENRSISLYGVSCSTSPE